MLNFNGLLLASGRGFDTPGGNNLWNFVQSTDGINWTTYQDSTIAGGGYPGSMATNGSIILVDTTVSGLFMSSTGLNGSWSFVAGSGGPGYTQKLSWTGSRFISQSRQAFSIDGITWTGFGCPISNPNIAFGGGVFVAVGGTAIYTTNNLTASPTWTARTNPLPPLSNQLIDVFYSGGQFVAITNGLSGNRTIVSYDYGATWVIESNGTPGDFVETRDAFSTFISYSSTSNGGRNLTAKTHGPTPDVGVTSISMNNVGNYNAPTPVPSVIFNDTNTGGSGAAGTAIMSGSTTGGDFAGTVQSSGQTTDYGWGYTSPPTITINQPGLLSGPGLSVASIVMRGHPSGIQFSGGAATYSISGSTADSTYLIGASGDAGSGIPLAVTVVGNVVTAVNYVGDQITEAYCGFVGGALTGSSVTLGTAQITFFWIVTSLVNTRQFGGVTFNGAGTSTFSSIPTLSFSAPDSTINGYNRLASANVIGNYTPIVSNYVVAGVTMTNNGSGYSTPPTVTFSGGSSPSPVATGTAVLGPI
jgi:hypothetical protein